MPVLDVRTYPDDVLRQKAAVVKVVDDDIRTLVDDMLETIKNNPNAVAIAAPQVGVLKQVIVIKAVDGITEEPLVLINPQVLQYEGKRALQMEEGCLSFPEMFAAVKRSPVVAVKALDRNGKEFEINATGFMAIVVQHEMDHLIGKMFFDRLGYLARRTILKKYGESQNIQKTSRKENR